jgi:hypothetical protein
VVGILQQSEPDGHVSGGKKDVFTGQEVGAAVARHKDTDEARMKKTFICGGCCDLEGFVFVP